jgi:hypothetical protein
MADGVEFDFGELDALAADLGDAPKSVIPRVRQAVERTAFAIKGDWRKAAQDANGAGHAKRYPAAVDYEMRLGTDGEIGADIGPDPSKGQGALGILEDAPGGVRSRPQRSRDRALRENLADFERGILNATEVHGL